MGDSRAQDPDVSGWIMKQKHSLVKTMDRRWAELYGSELRLFDAKESSIPNRIVNLAGATWVEGFKTAMQTSFTVITPEDATEQQYTFAVTDDEDLNKYDPTSLLAARADKNLPRAAAHSPAAHTSCPPLRGVLPQVARCSRWDDAHGLGRTPGRARRPERSAPHEPGRAGEWQVRRKAG